MASDTSAFSGALSFNTMIHMLHIRLTSTNFILWRRQILPLLQGHALFSHIDGSTPTPPSTIDSADDTPTSIVNPAFTSWKQQDQRLIWTTLESLFGNDSKQQEIGIHDQLLHLKKGSTSVREFSKSFCASVINLAPWADQWMILIKCTSFNEDWVQPLPVSAYRNWPYDHSLLFVIWCLL
ncbi:hypothetical protein RJT34_07502 [Clitoria ternatea]|uniref:Retrotransposon Copia-like N-terminal domain-containing protein n=1 Tax=Clitoria ternatea TaxID=43366 RepID=A0AAN9K546_CLITE